MIATKIHYFLQLLNTVLLIYIAYKILNLTQLVSSNADNLNTILNILVGS